MAITRISQSTVKEGLEKFNSFYGGASFLFGDVEAIQTINVLSNTSSVEFTNIPSTYKHLQLRGIFRSGRIGDTYLRMGWNQLSSNYAYHAIQAFNSSPAAFGATGQNSVIVSFGPGTSQLSNAYSGFITTILNYSDTNKTKVISSFTGYEDNSNGVTQFFSGFHSSSTDSISSIQLNGSGFDIVANSKFYLYGIKG